MNFTECQKNEVINNLMDVAANIDDMRQLSLITLTADGKLNVFQTRTDDATSMELLGIYRLLARVTERDIADSWADMERPNQRRDDL